MDKLIQKLKEQVDWQKLFQDYNRKNNFIKNPLNRLSDSNIEGLMKHIQKISEQKHPKHIISWVSTEYQILEIVLNTISVLTRKNVDDFAPSEWDQVCGIFPYKEPLTVKYESIRMIQEKKQHRRRWCASEENFLIEILKKSLRKNKWNDVARQLFIQSQGLFFRQGKHCRDRWLNHLHPSIQNNSWTREEDLKLLSFVLKRGKKWTQITKKFGMTRSECMVKKRFYELMNLEEEEVIPSDFLKNLIKKTLEKLKGDLNPCSVAIKSTDKNQSQVDKYQRKCNISKETLKTESMEKPLKKEIKPKFWQQPEGNKSQTTEKRKHLDSYKPQNVFQNFYPLQFYPNTLTHQVFGSYQAYNSLLRSQMNPLHSYYAQLMLSFQNSIFLNQMNDQGDKFYRF